MFRLPVLVCLALAIAFGGGMWSASWTLSATSGFGAIRLGSWTAFPQLQTSDADPFAKAHRAGDGRVLLGRAEGLVFTALTDQEGKPLKGNCAYEVSGMTPPTRFWTLRITGADGAPLTVPPRFPGSLNSWTTLRRADGGFSIRIGADPAPGNWIRLATTANVGLTLTLVDTPAAGSVGMAELDMPSITRIGCGDA